MAAKKVSISSNISSWLLFRRKRLIKQVLTPPFVAVSDEPHQLPGGMQSERPRSPCQFEPGLFRSPVAFAVIATVATRHQILPRRPPAARSWHHVIQRQLRTGEDPSTELAGIPVTQQNIFPR